MLTQKQLRDASAYGESLRVSVHGKKLPNSDRVRAAGSCFGIAQDHHHGILVLLGAGIYASCFALLRVIFEAYVRGEWLARCATDREVVDFLNGSEPPKIRVLLGALEQKESFQQGHLTSIKTSRWEALCGYTHTGGIHVQRWNSADGIEASYTADELLEALQFADCVATMSALGVLTLRNDVEAMEHVVQRFRARVAVDLIDEGP